MNDASLRTLILFASIVAGCGGKVVYEAGTSGAGGAGASGGGVSTSAVSVGSTSNASVTATSSSFASTSVTGSTSSGPSLCDNTGDCGDGSLDTGCIGCSLNGPCAEVLEVCVASPGCFEYSECYFGCDFPDPACQQACADQYPDGAVAYIALADCVLCEQCANDCAGFVPWSCPGNP